MRKGILKKGNHERFVHGEQKRLSGLRRWMFFSVAWVTYCKQGPHAQLNLKRS